MFYSLFNLNIALQSMYI